MWGEVIVFAFRPEVVAYWPFEDPGALSHTFHTSVRQRGGLDCQGDMRSMVKCIYQISLSKKLIKSQDVIRNAMKQWAEESKLPCKSDFSFLRSIFFYIYIIYIFFSVWALFVRLVTIAWMGRNRVHSAKPLDSNPISKGLFEGGHACLFVLLQSSEIMRMDTSSDKTFSIFFWKKWNADGQIALTLAFQVSRNSIPNALRECCFFFCRSLDDVFGWSDFHKH